LSSELSEPPEEKGVDPLEEAMQRIGRAMAALSAEEKAVVKQIQQEIAAAAASGGAAFDKRLEFCYSVKFSRDKFKSKALLDAVEAYITVAEGK
jgi:hypothetical protein